MWVIAVAVCYDRSAVNHAEATTTAECIQHEWTASLAVDICIYLARHLSLSAAGMYVHALTTPDGWPWPSQALMERFLGEEYRLLVACSNLDDGRTYLFRRFFTSQYHAAVLL